MPMDESPRQWRRLLAIITAGLAVAAGALALGRGWVRPSDDGRPRGPDVEQGQPRDILLAHGWGRPAPPRLIKPTYWPFVFGLGIVFLLGGIATRFLVSGVGLFIFAIGFIGWMMDLLDEQDNG
jgi:hypothetical protein